jgi:Integrase zinc binding domain/RNase H-like domain found in reverse transcriptase
LQSCSVYGSSGIAYTEKFEVITDHIALTWLLALRDPKERLARWIVEMQTYEFDVLYERGDEELIAVPDALSRDTMDKDIVLCHRCIEAVDAVSEDGSLTDEETRREEHERESREEDVMTVAEMAAAQVEAYGDGAALLENEDRQAEAYGDGAALLENEDRQAEAYGDGAALLENEDRQAEAYGDGAALLENEDRLRDEDGLICQVFGKKDVRVLVPPTLRNKVLKLVLGKRLGGHWGMLRTAARVRGRYFWPGWVSDVRKAVSECLACELGRMRRPGVQALIVRYHPSRRFRWWQWMCSKCRLKQNEGIERCWLLVICFRDTSWPYQYLTKVPTRWREYSLTGGCLCSGRLSNC